MPDYKFEALSSRSFEQVVQSLALAVLTPGTTPFGDGPDGGREATFDGPTNYVTTGEAWSGYGVIQAKFLQRPLGTTPDGRWALLELRKELRKYSHTDSKRRLPQNYIYATNATSSGVGRVGTKDQVFALLAQFAQQNNLAGFDVWDYDKLRALLDGQPDIRTTYDAWLTPGDVLAAVIARLPGFRPDFHTFMTKLLAREVLDNQYARLEQAGHNADAPVPLASVFVDLPFADQPQSDEEGSGRSGHPRIVETILDAAELKLDPATQAADGDAETRPGGRYVLIGGPGQGKTTVAQFLCQLFRAALLEAVPRHLLADEVASALRVLERQRESEGLALPAARRFPVHVVLNELGSYLAEATPDRASVVGFLASRMGQRLKQQVEEDYLRRWLTAYPVLVVFDGLDEVPASTNRDDVVASTANS